MIRILPTLFFAAVGLAMAMPQTQYIAIDKADPDNTFAFDWGGLDISGNPVDLELAEFIFRPHPAASPPSPDLRFPTSGMIKVGMNEYLASSVVADVPLGRYALKVRAKSQAGIFGEESNRIFIEILSKNPVALLRLRHVAKP